ncbi:MAG: TolC family protein [Planctomycetes bacterium]|nr:TolC family protein [Planctomycetota bacterium]
MNERRPTRVFVAAVCALTACSTASYVADADEEVDAVLGHARTTTLGNRESWVIRPVSEPLPPPESPAAEPPPPGAAAAAPPAAPVAATEIFDLDRALQTAVRQNRDFLSRREGLYREGLSIALTRFQFGPQFASAISYLWPQSEGGFQRHGVGATLSGSQILPTGGTLAVASGVDANWSAGPGSGDPLYGTTASVTLTQPLLRGAGYAISHEALTQAERELVYSIRDFEDFRESFTIGVAQRFFELTSQKKTLANEDRNYEAAVFDRGKAEALLQVGRNAEQEVFRARRREIEAKDQLINAKAAYDRALDEFKILLGVPTTTAIDLTESEPPYEPVRFEVGSAVAAARHNRLDLITDRQRVEDTKRALRIAENDLLPDLSLVASYGVVGEANDIGHAAPDEWSSSVGLTMEVPLQRKAQRNAYRSSLIALEQARRGLQLREDQLDLDIRDAMRSLKSLEERIQLQVEQIEQERAAVTVTQIRYEAGKLENRDLLEARQALVDAQNALIRLKVQHFVARLNLLKSMGLFFVDENGRWR